MNRAAGLAAFSAPRPCPSRRSVAQETITGSHARHRRDAREPGPADWLMWRRTLNGWGYSPLDQINRDNVGAAAA